LLAQQQTGERTRSCKGNKSGVCLLHFLALLWGSAIGSTPAFGCSVVVLGPL
jgi:hypothetical protein